MRGEELHTSSDMRPRLGDPPFTPWDGRNKSISFVVDFSQITVDCSEDSSRRVLAILTASIFVGDLCRVSFCRFSRF